MVDSEGAAIILVLLCVGGGFGVWGICVAVEWEEYEIQAETVTYTEEWDADWVCTTRYIGNTSYQDCEWDYDYYRYYTFTTAREYTYQYTWSKDIRHSDYSNEIVPSNVPVYVDGQYLRLSGPDWAWGMDVWFCEIINL